MMKNDVTNETLEFLVFEIRLQVDLENASVLTLFMDKISST